MEADGRESRHILIGGVPRSWTLEDVSGHVGGNSSLALGVRNTKLPSEYLVTFQDVGSARRYLADLPPSDSMFTYSFQDSGGLDLVTTRRDRGGKGKQVKNRRPPRKPTPNRSDPPSRSPSRSRSTTPDRYSSRSPTPPRSRTPDKRKRRQSRSRSRTPEIRARRRSSAHRIRYRSRSRDRDRNRYASRRNSLEYRKLPPPRNARRGYGRSPPPPRHRKDSEASDDSRGRRVKKASKSRSESRSSRDRRPKSKTSSRRSCSVDSKDLPALSSHNSRRSSSSASARQRAEKRLKATAEENGNPPATIKRANEEDLFAEEAEAPSESEQHEKSPSYWFDVMLERPTKRNSDAGREASATFATVRLNRLPSTLLISEADQKREILEHARRFTSQCDISIDACDDVGQDRRATLLLRLAPNATIDELLNALTEMRIGGFKIDVERKSGGSSGGGSTMNTPVTPSAPAALPPPPAIPVLINGAIVDSSVPPPPLPHHPLIHLPGPVPPPPMPPPSNPAPISHLPLPDWMHLKSTDYKASKTLYVRNLERHPKPELIKQRFSRWGDVLDVEVKNGDSPAPYAFVQFPDIKSVIRTMHEFFRSLSEPCMHDPKDPTYQRQRMKYKMNWGKTKQCSKIWLAEVPAHFTKEMISQTMKNAMAPSDVMDVLYDQPRHEAILTMKSKDSALKALELVRNKEANFVAPDNTPVHVNIDFCSDKHLEYFMTRMRKHPVPPPEPELLPITSHRSSTHSVPSAASGSVPSTPSIGRPPPNFTQPPPGYPFMHHTLLSSGLPDTRQPPPPIPPVIPVLAPPPHPPRELLNLSTTVPPPPPPPAPPAVISDARRQSHGSYPRPVSPARVSPGERVRAALEKAAGASKQQHSKSDDRRDRHHGNLIGRSHSHESAASGDGKAAALKPSSSSAFRRSSGDINQNQQARRTSNPRDHADSHHASQSHDTPHSRPHPEHRQLHQPPPGKQMNPAVNSSPAKTYHSRAFTRAFRIAKMDPRQWSKKNRVIELMIFPELHAYDRAHNAAALRHLRTNSTASMLDFHRPRFSSTSSIGAPTTSRIADRLDKLMTKDRPQLPASSLASTQPGPSGHLKISIPPMTGGSASNSRQTTPATPLTGFRSPIISPLNSRRSSAVAPSPVSRQMSLNVPGLGGFGSPPTPSSNATTPRHHGILSPHVSVVTPSGAMSSILQGAKMSRSRAGSEAQTPTTPHHPSQHHPPGPTKFTTTPEKPGTSANLMGRPRLQTTPASAGLTRPPPVRPSGMPTTPLTAGVNMSKKFTDINKKNSMSTLMPGPNRGRDSSVFKDPQQQRQQDKGRRESAGAASKRNPIPAYKDKTLSVPVDITPEKKKRKKGGKNAPAEEKEEVDTYLSTLEKAHNHRILKKEKKKKDKHREGSPGRRSESAKKAPKEKEHHKSKRNSSVGSQAKRRESREKHSKKKSRRNASDDEEVGSDISELATKGLMRAFEQHPADPDSRNDISMYDRIKIRAVASGEQMKKDEIEREKQSALLAIKKAKARKKAMEEGIEFDSDDESESYEDQEERQARERAIEEVDRQVAKQERRDRRYQRAVELTMLHHGNDEALLATTLASLRENYKQENIRGQEYGKQQLAEFRARAEKLTAEKKVRDEAAAVIRKAKEDAAAAAALKVKQEAEELQAILAAEDAEEAAMKAKEEAEAEAKKVKEELEAADRKAKEELEAADRKAKEEAAAVKLKEPKDYKEHRHSKEVKESKHHKDKEPKPSKDDKDSSVHKESKPSKEDKDPSVHKEPKPSKEDKRASVHKEPKPSKEDKEASVHKDPKPHQSEAIPSTSAETATAIPPKESKEEKRARKLRKKQEKEAAAAKELAEKEAAAAKELAEKQAAEKEAAAKKAAKEAAAARDKASMPPPPTTDKLDLAAAADTDKSESELTKEERRALKKEKRRLRKEKGVEKTKKKAPESDEEPARKKKSSSSVAEKVKEVSKEPKEKPSRRTSTQRERESTTRSTKKDRKRRHRTPTPVSSSESENESERSSSSIVNNFDMSDVFSADEGESTPKPISAPVVCPKAKDDKKAEKKSKAEKKKEKKQRKKEEKAKREAAEKAEREAAEKAEREAIEKAEREAAEKAAAAEREAAAKREAERIAAEKAAAEKVAAEKAAAEREAAEKAAVAKRERAELEKTLKAKRLAEERERDEREEAERLALERSRAAAHRHRLQKEKKLAENSSLIRDAVDVLKQQKRTKRIKKNKYPSSSASSDDEPEPASVPGPSKQLFTDLRKRRMAQLSVSPEPTSFKRSKPDPSASTRARSSDSDSPPPPKNVPLDTSEMATPDLQLHLFGTAQAAASLPPPPAPPAMSNPVDFTLSSSSGSSESSSSSSSSSSSDSEDSVTVSSGTPVEAVAEQVPETPKLVQPIPGAFNRPVSIPIPVSDDESDTNHLLQPDRLGERFLGDKWAAHVAHLEAEKRREAEEAEKKRKLEQEAEREQKLKAEAERKKAEAAAAEAEKQKAAEEEQRRIAEGRQALADLVVSSDSDDSEEADEEALLRALGETSSTKTHPEKPAIAEPEPAKQVEIVAKTAPEVKVVGTMATSDATVPEKPAPEATATVKVPAIEAAENQQPKEAVAAKRVQFAAAKPTQRVHAQKRHYQERDDNVVCLSPSSAAGCSPNAKKAKMATGISDSDFCEGSDLEPIPAEEVQRALSKLCSKQADRKKMVTKDGVIWISNKIPKSVIAMKKKIKEQGIHDTFGRFENDIINVSGSSDDNDSQPPPAKRAAPGPEAEIKILEAEQDENDDTVPQIIIDDINKAMKAFKNDPKLARAVSLGLSTVFPSALAAKFPWTMPFKRSKTKKQHLTNLLGRYPVVFDGNLCFKNLRAHVQFHSVFAFHEPYLDELAGLTAKQVDANGSEMRLRIRQKIRMRADGPYTDLLGKAIFLMDEPFHLTIGLPVTKNGTLDHEVEKDLETKLRPQFIEYQEGVRQSFGGVIRKQISRGPNGGADDIAMNILFSGAGTDRILQYYAPYVRNFLARNGHTSYVLGIICRDYINMDPKLVDSTMEKNQLKYNPMFRADVFEDEFARTHPPIEKASAESGRSSTSQAEVIEPSMQPGPSTAPLIRTN
uniref:RRM domain-containing protein n=1 Tax=Panagrellus redivivus TaxID=6233 RepID=A0A7E4VJW5_PANRE